MAPATLTRRAVVQGAGASLAAAAAGAQPALADPDARDRVATVPPEPIPGGIELAPGEVIHVWAPGPPEITLPFSGVTAQGLDVEPTTISDFKGRSALAFHRGTATDGDGVRYDVETDMRAFQGVFVDGTGTHRSGRFASICVDLFVPGSGTPAEQVHDFNGGIPASSLCWTVPLPDYAIRFGRDGRRAVMEARDVPVIDSFQFFGPNQVPASLSFRIEWRAHGPFVARGAGATVQPTDMAAFRGQIAQAHSTGWFAGDELGFSFTSERASSDHGGYAQVGFTRNGFWL
jgi:hypothetical protein